MWHCFCNVSANHEWPELNNEKIFDKLDGDILFSWSLKKCWGGESQERSQTEKTWQLSVKYDPRADTFALKNIIGKVSKVWMGSLGEWYMECLCCSCTFSVSLKLFQNKKSIKNEKEHLGSEYLQICSPIGFL